MIDLEDLHPGQLQHAPRATVVAGAEDDELRGSMSDRGANRAIDRCSSKRDHVRHPTRHLEPDAGVTLPHRALSFRETLLSLLVEKNARGRIVEIRDVR